MNSTTSFTFLATLFVLLFISASIIFRSFLIRRRFRQQVEGALAQGGYLNLSPSGLSFTARFIGEKPKVHEAWIEQSVREKTHWQDIMPVTTLLTRSTETIGESRLPQDPPQQRPSFLARLKRRTESTDSHTTPNVLDPSPDDTVSVCVLISMPHPDSPAHCKRLREDSVAAFKSNQPHFSMPTGSTIDENGVPNVVFGTTELPVLGTWTETQEGS